MQTPASHLYSDKSHKYIQGHFTFLFVVEEVAISETNSFQNKLPEEEATLRWQPDDQHNVCSASVVKYT